MRSEEFRDYFKDKSIQINANYGYIHFMVNKEYYFPGEIVRGRIYVHLNKTIKTSQAILKITAEENTGIELKKPTLRPEPIIKRQTFRENNNSPSVIERERYITDMNLPTIKVNKAVDELEEGKNTAKTPKPRG